MSQISTGRMKGLSSGRMKGLSSVLSSPGTNRERVTRTTTVIHNDNWYPTRGGYLWGEVNDIPIGKTRSRMCSSSLRNLNLRSMGKEPKISIGVSTESHLRYSTSESYPLEGRRRCEKVCPGEE